MKFKTLSRLIAENAEDDLGVRSIPKTIAQFAKDAGFKVEEITPHDYEEHSTDFELAFDTGLVMYLSVSPDGNVVWWDFNKKFEMGNMKQPDRITDNFYKIKDGGGMHDSLFR